MYHSMAPLDASLAVQSYLLRNQNGMEVRLLDYGARVSSIRFPVNGSLEELTLAYESAEQFIDDPFYLGATVGRVSNRIAQGRFTLNGQQYQAVQNNGEHCLHGGSQGFSYKHWQLAHQDIIANKLTFSLLSEAGEQGFPGELLAKVSYQLTEDNQLMIAFQATTDQDTPVSLCNHCYFHLGETNINDLDLQLNSHFYLPTDNTGIPIEPPQSTKNTDFCFSQQRAIGQAIERATSSQIGDANGYDHCYVLAHSNVNKNRLAEPVAILRGRTNGITMQLYTDQPGLQLYSGQYLNHPFQPLQAVCLEAQGIPNAINSGNEDLRNEAILRKEKQYCAKVIYQFSRSD